MSIPSIPPGGTPSFLPAASSPASPSGEKSPCPSSSLFWGGRAPLNWKGEEAKGWKQWFSEGVSDSWNQVLQWSVPSLVKGELGARAQWGVRKGKAARFVQQLCERVELEALSIKESAPLLKQMKGVQRLKGKQAMENLLFYLCEEEEGRELREQLFNLPLLDAAGDVLDELQEAIQKRDWEAAGRALKEVQSEGGEHLSPTYQICLKELMWLVEREKTVSLPWVSSPCVSAGVQRLIQSELFDLCQLKIALEKGGRSDQKAALNIYQKHGRLVEDSQEREKALAFGDQIFRTLVNEEPSKALRLLEKRLEDAEKRVMGGCEQILCLHRLEGLESCWKGAKVASLASSKLTALRGFLEGLPEKGPEALKAVKALGRVLHEEKFEETRGILSEVELFLKGERGDVLFSLFDEVETELGRAGFCSPPVLEALERLRGQGEQRTIQPFVQSLDRSLLSLPLSPEAFSRQRQLSQAVKELKECQDPPFDLSFVCSPCFEELGWGEKEREDRFAPILQEHLAFLKVRRGLSVHRSQHADFEKKWQELEGKVKEGKVISVQEWVQIERDFEIDLGSEKLRASYQEAALVQLEEELEQWREPREGVLLKSWREEFRQGELSQKGELLQCAQKYLSGGDFSDLVHSLSLFGAREGVKKPLENFVESGRARALKERMLQVVDLHKKERLEVEDSSGLEELLRWVEKGEKKKARQSLFLILEGAKENPTQWEFWQRIEHVFVEGEGEKWSLLEPLLALMRGGEEADWVQSIRQQKLRMIQQNLIEEVDHHCCDQSGMPRYPKAIEEGIKGLRQAIQGADLDDPKQVSISEDLEEVFFKKAHRNFQKLHPVKKVCEPFLSPSIVEGLEPFQGEQGVPQLLRRVEACQEKIRPEVIGGRKAADVDFILSEVAKVRRDLVNVQKRMAEQPGSKELSEKLDQFREFLDGFVDDVRSTKRILQVMGRKNPASVALGVANLVEALVLGKEVQPSLEGLRDQLASASDERFFRGVVDTLRSQGLEGVWELYFGEKASAQKKNQMEALKELVNWVGSEEGRENLLDFLTLRGFNLVLSSSSEGETKKALRDYVEMDQKELFSLLDGVLEHWSNKINSALSREEKEEDLSQEVEKGKSDVELFLERLVLYGVDEGGAKTALDRLVFAPLENRIKEAKRGEKVGIEAFIQNLIAGWKESGIEEPLQKIKGGPMPHLDALMGMATSAEGLHGAARLCAFFAFQVMNQEDRPKTFDELKQIECALDQQLTDLKCASQAGEVVQSAHGWIVEQIKQEFPPVPDNLFLNINDFLVTPDDDTEALLCEELLVLQRVDLEEGQGKLDVVVPAETFERVLTVALKQALVNGSDLVDLFQQMEVEGERKEETKGESVLNHILKETVLGIQAHLEAPTAALSWDGKKEAAQIGDVLLDPHYTTLPFPPAVRYLLEMVLTPGTFGGAPFRLLGTQPLGEQGLEEGLNQELLNDLLESTLADPDVEKKLKKLTKRGKNVYDTAIVTAIQEVGKKGLEKLGLKKTSPKKELSDGEKALGEAYGSLAITLMKKSWGHDEKSWLVYLDAQPKLKSLLGEGIRELVHENLLQTIGSTLNIPEKELPHWKLESHHLKQYLLIKSQQAIETREQGKEQDVKERFLHNMGLAQKYLEPVSQNRSLLSLLWGAVTHELYRFCLLPILWVVRKVQQWLLSCFGFQNVRETQLQFSGETFVANTLGPLQQGELPKKIYQRLFSGDSGMLTHLGKWKRERREAQSEAERARVQVEQGLEALERAAHFRRMKEEKYAREAEERARECLTHARFHQECAKEKEKRCEERCDLGKALGERGATMALSFETLSSNVQDLDRSIQGVSSPPS